MAPTSPHVLIYAPLGDDAQALAEEVEAVGLSPRSVADAEEFAFVREHDALASILFIVISQEGATSLAGETLCQLHASEPVWARLPVLFLVSSAQRMPPACRILKDCPEAPNFISFERPVQRSILRQGFRALSESRRRQFHTRDLIDSLRIEKERNSFLLDELNHRVRNSLAVLQSLFRMSSNKAASVRELEEAFGARLRSLSDAYTRLSRTYDNPPNLADVLEEHVTPYAASPNQLLLEGNPIELSINGAFKIAMSIHELATNAAKYGALSTPTGQVKVSWSRDERSGNLNLIWQESGGPPVDPPESTGLGSILISKLKGDDVRPPRMEFNRKGVVWKAQISAADIL